MLFQMNDNNNKKGTEGNKMHKLVSRLVYMSVMNTCSFPLVTSNIILQLKNIYALFMRYSCWTVKPLKRFSQLPLKIVKWKYFKAFYQGFKILKSSSFYVNSRM